MRIEKLLLLALVVLALSFSVVGVS